MDPVNGIPLDEFHLDERIYERSKKWASFITQTSERCWNDDNDFSFDEICDDRKYKTVERESADDTDSLNLSFELTDEEVSEGCKGAFNMSVLKLRSLSESLAEKRKGSKIVKNKISRLIPKPIKEEPDEEEDEVILIDRDDDMQNMVDQTLPILAERERKWVESGMLNVLNTFDEKKIEEKVGTWLKNTSTHNSTFNVPFISHPQQKQQFHKHDYCAEAKYPCSYLVNTCAPDTEEESLHSMDTARYIRSNRKPRNGTTMNIKTFRLLQSKRNALREKYSLSEAEYQSNKIKHVHHHHMQKKIPIPKLYLPYDNKCEISLETSGCSQQNNRRRRKILNKRRARTLLVSSYSSTSDSYNETTSDEEEFAENKSLVANSYRQCRHRKQSSAYKFTTMHQKSSAKRKCDFDERPQKRASECCCCDEVKLCKGIRHLADTSTEEWIVENCLTPKKAIRKKILRHNRITKDKIVHIHKQLKEKLKNDRKKPKNIAVGIDHVQGLGFEKDLIDFNRMTFENHLKSAINISKKECEEETSISKLNANKDPNMKTSAEIKTKNTLLKIASDVDQVQDSVFEKHSKGSIEIQNKSCIKELSKSEIGKSEDANKKNKKERKTRKPVLEDKKKSSKKQKINTKIRNEKKNVKHDLEETHDSTFERDLELALKISKNLHEKETYKPKYTNNDSMKRNIEQKTKNNTLEKTKSKSTENSSKQNNDMLVHVFDNNTDLNKSSDEDEEKIKKKSLEKTKSKSTENSSKKNKDMLVHVFDDNTDLNKSSDEAPDPRISKENRLQRKKSLEQMLNQASTSPGSSAEKKLKPQPKSIKQKYLKCFKEKMRKLGTTTKDETFFALKNANICNSTAKANGGIAIAKELSSASSSRNSNYAANQNSGKLKSLTNSIDETDCAVVSSTTCDSRSINNKGILLYTPKNHNVAPARSISNGEFHLTEEHLSSVIGEKSACKFFKHYIGRLRFDANLSLFFRPPRNTNADTSSESDDDPLEQLGEHGSLYVSFND